MKKKKGFTLVELLVVIAILAVLATVSVVGYMGFTKKAHESNDIGLTTQMNTILQAEEVTNKPTSPHEAVQQLANGGVDVEKLTPTTDGYNYVYDLDANRMFLLNDQKGIVAPTNITFTKDLNVFAFVGSENDIKNLDGYSYYLKSNFTFTGTKLEIKAGLDVGNNNISEISYTNTGANVLIRTNGGKLTVNDATGSVNHYGLLEKAVIENINSSSYHEYGYVTDYIEAKNGHIVIEKGASVSILAVNGDPTVDQKEGSELYKVVPVGENTTVNTNKVKVLNNVTVAKDSVTTVDLSNMKYGGGNGSEEKPYELYTASHLVAFAKDVNKGNFEKYVYVKLCADVNIGNMAWEPIGNIENPFNGSFDGCDKTISGLTNKGYTPEKALFGISNNAKNFGTAYGFFGVIGVKESNGTDLNFANVSFDNVNIDIDYANMLGVLIGADVKAAKDTTGKSINENFSSKITMDKINVNGNIVSKSGASVGGIAGKLYTSGDVTVKNCNVNCQFNLTNSIDNGKTDIKAGGIIGYRQNAKLNIESCNADLDVKAITSENNLYFGGFACNHSASTSIKNSTLKGNIELSCNSNYIVIAAMYVEDCNYNKSKPITIESTKNDINKYIVNGNNVVSDLNKNDVYSIKYQK